MVSRLEAIRGAFRQRLPQRAVEIQQALDLLTATAAAQASLAGVDASPELQALHTLLHQLSGSAGSHGVPEVSACARRGDEHLRAVVAGTRALDAELLRSISDELLRLAASAAAR